MAEMIGGSAPCAPQQPQQSRQTVPTGLTLALTSQTDDIFTAVACESMGPIMDVGQALPYLRHEGYLMSNPALGGAMLAAARRHAASAVRTTTTHTTTVATHTTRTTSTTRTGSRSATTTHTSASSYMSYGSAPAGIGPWTPVAGHPTYALGNFAGDPYSGAYGTCTWYAWYHHQSEPLMRLGDAAQWAANAPRYGLRVTSSPVVGATAVFAPGVQGAGGGGHAAHVEAILGGGWFIISEMNFYWNGGGFGRVDYRYVHTGPGVSFIL